MQSVPAYRYEELAGFITGLVHRHTAARVTGAVAASDLQATANQPFPALQAYRLLEDRGVLEARPQSGYYVRGGQVSLQLPAATRPPGKATNVALSGVVLELLEYAADPRFVPLGCAVPSTDLLAAGRLDRFLARAARVKGVEYNTYSSLKGDLPPAPGDRPAGPALGAGPVP